MRLVVVDDHPLFRAGLATELTRRSHVIVACVGSVVEAIEAVKREAVDVVLMDVRLPGVDGIAGTRAVLEADPTTRVVILSTFDEPMVLDAARVAGAAAFLSKESSIAEVDQTVRRVRTEALPVIASASDLPRLTSRESDVLRELASGRSNPEIAESLGIGTETVKSHVEAILGKFGVRDRVALMRELHRLGWGIVHSLDDSPGWG